MSKAKSSKAKPAKGLKFEEALTELEVIIERIEQGEIELEDSLDAYRRGLELVKQCRSILDKAEKDVEELTVEELGDSADTKDD